MTENIVKNRTMLTQMFSGLKKKHRRNKLFHQHEDASSHPVAENRNSSLLANTEHGADDGTSSTGSGTLDRKTRLDNVNLERQNHVHFAYETVRDHPLRADDTQGSTTKVHRDLGHFQTKHRPSTPPIEKLLERVYRKLRGRPEIGDLERLRNVLESQTDDIRPEHIPGLDEQGTLMSSSEFSWHVHRAMDSLGFSNNMLRYRYEMFPVCTGSMPDFSKHGPYMRVLMEGTLDGSTCVTQHQKDFLLVPKETLCVASDGLNQLPGYYTVFEMSTEGYPIGFTEMRLVRFGSGVATSLKASLVMDGANLYVSSRLFQLRTEHGHNTHAHEQFLAGCKLDEQHDTHTVDAGALPQYGFRCLCQTLLDCWSERIRFHGWPSKELIQKVQTLEAFLLPAEAETMTHSHRLWEIRFMLAEQCLLQSLSDCQYKVLAMLNWIVQYKLETWRFKLTPFIIRNIVFWMCEEKPHEDFRDSTLLACTLQGLQRLRDSVIDNKLPYYFLPTRNLLADSGNIEFGQSLCRALTTLIDTGPPRILLAAGRLGSALQRLTSEQLEIYRERRDDLEATCWRLLALQQTSELHEDIWDFTPDPARSRDVRRLQRRMIHLVAPGCLKHDVSVCCNNRINMKIRWLLN
ncbi:hypothetical protein MAR_004585 [Mya arenaria]|uniref:Mab-21-like HhH/H2TH-like domain-containing protein n=1 Tax=Mya arenaria TaxID=6604 RepID=A0ABY7EWZ6_MYAAR|nr:uncharacterized protein LOC128203468 [Mya arenaria]WAR14480.1 hypothetical protein MAR_004585 [Mya arenaria]